MTLLSCCKCQFQHSNLWSCCAVSHVFLLIFSTLIRSCFRFSFVRIRFGHEFRQFSYLKLNLKFNILISLFVTADDDNWFQLLYLPFYVLNLQLCLLRNTLLQVRGLYQLGLRHLHGFKLNLYCLAVRLLENCSFFYF